MRINRETLIRIARETAQKRAYSEPELVAAYLSGSLRAGEPFLGGSTDIDIILVHPGKPRVRREIVALTPEVHLDLLHQPRSDYDKPKELRVHPWLGPELYDPLPLHVSGHFFEFIQAGVRDKFHETENTLARARTSLARARQVWMGLGDSQESGPDLLLGYLKSLRHAANTVALLQNGSPLAERRFLLQFPAFAAAAGKPGLSGALLRLLGWEDLPVEGLGACLDAWEQDFTAAAGRPKADERIALPRLGYYKLAFASFLQDETPHAVLWPLLLTWALAARALPPSRQGTWESTCKGLGLLGGAWGGKLAGLDGFLDDIEEMLENEAPGGPYLGTGTG